MGEARFSFTDESGDRLAFTAPHVTGKVRRSVPISAHEVEFVRAITDRDDQGHIAVAIDNAVLVRPALRCL